MGSNWTVLILMLISCEGGDLTGESKREQYRTGSLTVMVMVVMRLMVMVIKTVEVMIKAWERNAVEGWRQRWRLTGKKGKTKKLLQTMMMLIIFLLGIVDISDVQMCWCSWYLMVSAPRVLRQASSSDFERIRAFLQLR